MMLRRRRTDKHQAFAFKQHVNCHKPLAIGALVSIINFTPRWLNGMAGKNAYARVLAGESSAEEAGPVCLKLVPNEGVWFRGRERSTSWAVCRGGWSGIQDMWKVLRVYGCVDESGWFCENYYGFAVIFMEVWLVTGFSHVVGKHVKVSRSNKRTPTQDKNFLHLQQKRVIKNYNLP